MTSTTTSRTTTGPGLVYEFGYTADLGAPLDVGPVPAGNRLIVPITGGRATGERISGEVLVPAGNWVTLGADGWGSLDVRGQIRTDDGAVLHYRAEGVVEINEAVQRYLAGVASTEFSDHYARLYYRLESGDDRYAWVNRTMFVGEPRLVVDGDARRVEVRIHRVS